MKKIRKIRILDLCTEGYFAKIINLKSHQKNSDATYSYLLADATRKGAIIIDR